MKSTGPTIKKLRLITKLSLVFAVCAMFFATAASVNGQLRRISRASSTTTTSSTDLVAAAADLDQCQNGVLASPESCDGANWVNGNVNPNKAHWKETESLVYRMKMTGLSTGPGNTHTLIIGYDITKNGPHAIDYLTSFDRTETTGAGNALHANLNNPCFGFSCTTSSPTSTFPIPADNVTVTNQTNADAPHAPVPQVAGVFTMWNGTITGVSYVTYAGGEERQISVTFTANSSDVLLAWGGHVAWQGEWGFGLSAGGISGSPYHMRLISLDGTGGNQDRALSAAAVGIPAKVTIVKDVPQGASTVPFRFQVTNLGSFTTNCLLTDFPDAQNGRDVCLDDNGVENDTYPSQFSFPAILTQFNAAFTPTVTEPQGFGPTTVKQLTSAWHITGLGCVETNVGGSVANVNVTTTSLNVQSGANLATIKPDLGDSIQCTFTNQIVTAAPASISGKVVTSTGLGILRAKITVIDAATGVTKTAFSNQFGMFTVTGLEVEKLYLVTVSHPNYVFATNTQSFVLNEDLTGLLFTANPPPTRNP